MIDDTHPAGSRSPEYNDGVTAGTAPIGSKDGARNTMMPGDGSARTDETGELISADKVLGTVVYGGNGDRIGTIDSIMIGKRSGQVAYAVMSFGGFLGIGERYHPLPWNTLSYDEMKDGYRVGHSADALRSAPNYSRDELDRREYRNAVDEYYGGATTPGAARM